MSWWVLVLCWLLLLLGVIVLVALVGLSTFRRFRALLRAIGEATEQLVSAAEGRVPGPAIGGPTGGGDATST